MDERTKKAFDFAGDTAKQILALSSGIIALTITFSKDLVGEVPQPAKTYLIWAWVFYLLSILFGVATLMALTASLGATQEPAPPSVYSRSVRLSAGTQIVCFLLALVLTVIFGAKAIRGNPAQRATGAGEAPALSQPAR